MTLNNHFSSSVPAPGLSQGAVRQESRIAITGGIGSGKSFVCRLLGQRGIRVYDCDAAAKRLMRTSSDLRQRLCQLAGDDVYVNNELQKPVLARFLLASETNARAVDAIVHPAVASDFLASGERWMESAILFESGFNSLVSHVVCVYAPEELRISRVMARDNISREKTLAWLARQMDQQEVAKRSHFVIVNDGQQPLEPQIDSLLASLG